MEKCFRATNSREKYFSEGDGCWKYLLCSPSVPYLVFKLVFRRTGNRDSLANYLLEHFAKLDRLTCGYRELRRSTSADHDNLKDWLQPHHHFMYAVLIGVDYWQQ